MFWVCFFHSLKSVDAFFQVGTERAKHTQLFHCFQWPRLSLHLREMQCASTSNSSSGLLGQPP
nr:MAG TPA: hypothetical protein [Caudoviricetes sp.]